MQNRYKLIPIDNGEFMIKENDSIIADTIINGTPSISISNSKQEILEMYENARIEKEALEKYPDDIYGVNELKREAYIEAIKSNKAKYTLENLRVAYNRGFGTEQGLNQIGQDNNFYFLIKSLQPKLEAVEVELEMENRPINLYQENSTNPIGYESVPKITDNKVKIIRICN